MYIADILEFFIFTLQKRWAQKEVELREAMKMTNDPNTIGAGSIVLY